MAVPDPRALPAPDISGHLPPGYPVADDATIQQYLTGPQGELDALTRDINRTLRDLQLSSASGTALDVLGWSKGLLGERGTRGDDEYRQFLIAIPNAFEGYHRRKDVRRAISSGINADSDDDVELTEDVAGNTYRVTLHSWQEHTTGLVDTLCRYADGAGIERAGPLTYDWGAAGVGVGGGSFTLNAAISFGRATVTVGRGGGIEQTVDFEDGWGGFAFDEGYRFDIEDPVVSEHFDDGGYGDNYDTDYR